MQKRKLLIRTLILVNIIVPIFAIFVSSASASWMGDSLEISSPVLTGIDPSVYMEPGSRKMHYTFTLQDPISSYIAYSNNSGGLDGMLEYEDFTDPAKTPPNNYTQCGHSDIYVYNGTVHIVFEAILEGNSYYDIFYTNNSAQTGNFSQNIINVTGTPSVNSRYPSISGVNNTIWIAYQENNGTTDQIYIKTNNGTNSVNETGIAYQVLNPGASDASMPKIEVLSEGSYFRLDLMFLRANEIIYQKMEQGGLAELNTTQQTISETSIDDFDFDSNEDLIVIAYADNDNIYTINSTDAGDSFAGSSRQLTSGSAVEGYPEVAIDTYNNTHIYYTKNVSSTESFIYVQDNHDAWFLNEEPIIGPEELPNTDVLGNKILLYDFDIDILDNAIFCIYTANYTSDGGTPVKPHLYTFGYHLFYNYGDDDYCMFSYTEPSIGAYLVEGVILNYNYTVSDLNITFRFTDLVSNETWENNTILQSSGGEQTRTRFFAPDNYFLTKNNYTFEILNGSNNMGLLKIDFDPTEYETYQNISIAYPEFPEGIDFNYTFYEENHYLWVDFEFQPVNPFTSLQTYGGGYMVGEDLILQGGFDSTNYADLYKFEMASGDTYNFSYWDNSSYTKLHIYNDSVQTTSEENAILTFTGTPSQRQYITFIANESANYYVFIESTNFTEDSIYYFNYSIAPRAPVLVSPPNNNYTTATEITFKWRRNPDDELAEFSKFRFQVSSDPTFTTGVHEVTRNKTEWTRQTQGAYTFYFYTYNLSQNTKYYWRVRAIDSGDNYGLWTQWILNIDNADPQPPVLLEPDEVFTTIFVDLNWTEPSDGPYRPKSYNVYRGLERDFECDSTTMVSTAGYVFNTYYTDDTPGTDKYYYRVTAVDNVGFESEPSNVVEAIVSIGGYVDARFQTFSVFEGNYFEYRIIDIVDYEQHDPQQRFISFLGHTFQWNSIFHYYINTVDNTDVFPVSGRWYQKYSNETTLREEYFLVDSNANFIPMITSSNITYQTNVFDWFMNNVFTGEADEDFNSTITNSTYVDGLLIRNVVVHSYAGEIDPVGSATPRVFSGGIFVVDRESGILVEMTIYNKVDRVGYAIQLITTSYPLPVSTWIWNSIFLIIGLMIVAAVVNQIIKSLERRV